MKRVAIFDIDGVLADGWPALQESCMEPGAPDWDLYHELICEAPVLANGMAELVRSYFADPDTYVVMITCRTDRIHRQTKQWLERNGLHHDELFTRAESTRNVEHKVAVVTWLRAQGLEIMLAFDDSPEQIDALEAIDVPTVYVHSGYYDDHQPWRQPALVDA